jgi:ribosomal protein L16 Arg81 hydroxylase
LDTDDVLVIHLAGEKRWRIYRRQAPRRINLADLDDAQMGREETEVVMRPGDVLYLRSFTPHRVETLAPYSLHLSFDLCDRQPSIELALQLLLRQYDRDSSMRPTPPREDLDKLFRLSRTPAYESDLAQAQAQEKAGHTEFRQLLTNNRITHLDHLIQVGRQADVAPRAIPGTSVRGSE